jgi:hypothetical protein
MLASRSTLPAGVTLFSKPVTEQQILDGVRRALDARKPQPPAGEPDQESATAAGPRLA